MEVYPINYNKHCGNSKLPISCCPYCALWKAKNCCSQNAGSDKRHEKVYEELWEENNYYQLIYVKFKRHYTYLQSQVKKWLGKYVDRLNKWFNHTAYSKKFDCELIILSILFLGKFKQIPMPKPNQTKCVGNNGNNWHPWKYFFYSWIQSYSYTF